jgi:CRISPR/Cas system-associated exonuclease Cas4 (RecB family)
MKQTKRIYVHGAFDEGYTCVFPNEVVARSYLADYALHSPRKAILADRAISFDTFKAMFLPVRKTEVPANAIIRELFVTQLLQQPGVLTYFVSEQYPEANSRFSRYVSTLLPMLADAMEPEALALMPAAMQKDVKTLYHRYVRFLSDHGCFEPGFERPSMAYSPQDLQEKRYCILFADTIPGARNLWEQLGQPSWLTLSPTPVPEDPSPIFEVFDNFMQELHTALRRIKALLADGVPARDIVIGCGSPQVMLPYLEQEAWLYDVPLSVVEGKSPLLYPSGRFLSRLKAVYDEQFSLESMKALLLDTGFPWRHIDRHRDLVSSAVKYSVLGGSRYQTDQWEKQIRDRASVNWYRDFKQSVVALCQASDIDDLRRKLNHFQDTYFVETQWNGTAGEDVYAFCLNAMEAIKNGMERSAIDTYPGLFSFFLSYLENQRYVPQKTQEGIAVYGWPMTATADPAYHFLIALDHEGSRCVHKPLALLPQTVEGEARKEIDTTDALFRAALDGAGQLFVSCHLARYEGQFLPPSCFVEQSLVCKKREQVAEVADQFESERMLWAGLEPPGTASGRQQTWFSAAQMTVLLEREDDFARKAAPLSIVPFLKKEVDGVSVLRLSSTGIDEFLRCPYAWLCHYLYRATQTDYQVPAIDHRAIGAFLHQVYQDFFSTIGYFDPRKKPEYRQLLQQQFDTELDAWFGEGGPNPPTREWIVSEYRQACTAILDEEEALFAHRRSPYSEESLSHTTDRYSLYGRIDRIVELADAGEKQYAVVDYKKGKPPYRKLQVPLPSYQLPVYRKLVAESLGGDVVNASYYSIKDKAYTVIWGKDDIALMETCDQELEKRLDEIVTQVEGGHFEATPSREHCKNCVYRQVCRRRYATR